MFYIDKTVTHEGADYHIRCMTGKDEMELMGGLALGENIPAERLFRLLERCLIGWDNAKTLRGEEMGIFDKAKIEWLPAVTADFLCAEIMRMSHISDDEKKTSSDLPPSDSTPASSDAAIAAV